MDKREFEAMAYTDPPYYMTPPHEREILKEIGSGRSYMQPHNAPPLRLLSLDGGGVKGYSSLLLLQEVMYRLFVEIHGRPPQMHEIPLPCDHFDLIGGVGTGGLIGLMLGRLRMDIETCKETWVKMTKRVFETDKTIVGIPYKTTFFKASKLESAIKEITREFTSGEEELTRPKSNLPSNSLHNRSMSTVRDKSDPPMRVRTRSGSAGSAESRYSKRSDELKRLAEEEGDPEQRTKFDPLVRHKSHSDTPSIMSSILPGRSKSGNPESLLYDPREDRCKTFVAAMYQNSPEGTPPCLLRTYLSLTTLNPEPNVKIWEAGRATAATMTAFKPIQIGQTCFLDEGAGRYNITPTMLEEATCNEWPGRAVGCLLSIGTGRPPPKKQTSATPWWENKIHTPFDDFTAARKRLITKTHISEDIHQMLIGGGPNGVEKWGVQRDDYFRLNVDIGVGDFAMNDWQRLADISTNTRRWLTSNEGKKLVGNCAMKLANIWRARNLPPPKSPLRMMQPMAELPVEPFPYPPTSNKPLPQEPPQSPASTYTLPIEATPRPPSRGVNRTRTMPHQPTHETSNSSGVIPMPSVQPVRSRTVQGNAPQSGPPTSNSLPQDYFPPMTGRLSQDEQPRPLTIRQRSQTTGPSMTSSSSATAAAAMSASERERRFDKQQYMNIQAGVSSGRSRQRRVVTDGVRPNPPYPDD